MNNIAIIPARSGSKGLKDKNILELAGKPLLWYTIRAAKESGCFHTIMVSTDSKQYAEIAMKCGAEVPFLRSRALSMDNSGSWDVVREVLNRYIDIGFFFDYAALLQPTSPLRKPEDIKGAFSVLKGQSAGCVVSVVEVEHPIQWCFRMRNNGFISELANSPYNNCRRQDLDIYYRENGAIYIVNAKKILRKDYNFYSDECYGYLMPKKRSVDIDTEYDFKYAAFMMNEQRNEVTHNDENDF